MHGLKTSEHLNGVFELRYLFLEQKQFIHVLPRRLGVGLVFGRLRVGVIIAELKL